MSHHKFNEHKTAHALAQRMAAGEQMALVTDAGTPAVSDPGFLLVRECVEQGVEVQKQASEAMVSPEVLQQSFHDTMEALEDLSKYRQEALPVMKKTIDTFRELAETGEAQIEKMDQAIF